MSKFGSYIIKKRVETIISWVNKMDAKGNITGLNTSEVLKSRKLNGSNVINNQKRNSFVKLLLESFGDPIIKILILVLAVKTVFLLESFNWFETLGIVIAILLASIISTISEYGSEKAFEKLQEETSKIKCKVYRNGELVNIFLEDVVVGDCILLSSGDKVPADGVVLSGNITCDESSFTGETKDVEKKINSEVYRGSIVLNNQAIIKITAVGSHTKYGKIASELLDKNPESPLRAKLRELANIISRIGYTGAILVFFSYLFSVIVIQNNFDINVIWQVLTTPKIIIGHIIYALTLAVTIIIVSVPEGLPMMIALVLSSNMKRMIKNNVLVRRMVGIETSGRLDVLFSDKTGTITKGVMEVTGLILGSGEVLRDYNEVKNYKNISKYILGNMKINNESKIDNNSNIIGGNITDKALMQFAYLYECKYKLVKQNYFNSENKYSSVIIDDGTKHELIKGAPELLLTKIREYYDVNGTKKAIDKSFIKSLILKYTNLGYRVLLLADKPNSYSDSLIYTAMVLLKDEISDTAFKATNSLINAGIHLIMVTGDAKETAVNIAREIKLVNSRDDIILTSKDLAIMSDDMIKSIFSRIKVIARALPTDKKRLVKIAQSLGKVVGMTGDGVNDSPALKCADVGFAMGSGSEVAKEASDIVILDNNLLSISKAVLYGRTIFKSIRKFIIFQLTMNICALTLSIFGPFLGISTPVTVMQMLWINMIMDTLAGLAFSFEPPLVEYMNNRPLKKDASILNSYMYSSILITGVYSAIILILFLKLPFLRNIFRFDIDQKYLMTAFFGLFVFSGVFNAFNARTNRINIFANLSKNQPFILIVLFIIVVQVILLYSGGHTFRTFGLTLKEFLVMMLFAISVIPVDVIRKLILKKNNLNTGV